MNTRIIQRVTVAVTCIVLSAASLAFTWGDLRGSAILGQPLDVSVWVNAGDEAPISDECLSAQLLFGDLQQPSPNLRLQNPSPNAAAGYLVRIKSSVAVNEPIVTLVLRTACGAVSSRSYVLLSDFPLADLPTVSTLPATKPAGAALTNPQPASTREAISPPLQTVTPQPIAAGSKPAAKARPKPTKSTTKPDRKKKPSPKSPAPTQAKRDTTRVASDTGQLVLKLDSEMFILNPDELAAMAARRVSLPTLEPEGDVLKQSMQLESLQNDLKAFKELTTKNQASLAALEAKLRQAETERLSMTWLYLLAGLLVAAIVALAWTLRKQQKTKQAWWHQANDNRSRSIGTVTSAARSVQPAPLTDDWIADEVLATPSVQDADLIDLDFNLDNLSEAPATEINPAKEELTDPFGPASDFSNETVSDIRQQAEFFVSLGQASRAIDLLRRQILEGSEPNPLVYLDLLTLYHSQGMKVEFREMRVKFNRFFHCISPDFPVFYQEGRDLLGYPDLLVELVSTWSNGNAAAFIDGCIFRKETSALHVGFDLAAFRDLLLLRTLVDKTKSLATNSSAKSLDANSNAVGMVDVPDIDISRFTKPPVEDQPTQPDAMTATRSGWSTTSQEPTTEEQDLEFPIDMLKNDKAPGN